MQVTVFAPRIWQPALNAASADLPPQAAALMRAVVRHLHDRHVGIAPRPAARLAQTLLRDGRPASRPLSAHRNGLADWTAAVERLIGGLLPDTERDGAWTSSAPGVILPASVPFALLDRVALPLVAAAQDRMGRCCLFGGDGHESPRNGAQLLTEYETEQEGTLADLCTGLGSNPPPLFWNHRGTDLAALSRRLGTGATAEPLPDADAETVALLLRLDPALGPMVRPPAHSRRPQRAALQTSGVRPREGGVAGIRTTRTMDDINDMVTSEFTNHPLILLDRLVNSGFMVRHRPPRRQNRRDVLLVGAMPSGSRDSAGRLAKVSWIDTMARIAPLLQDAGLPRSDFAWLDGDRLGGLACGFAGLPPGLPLPGGGVSLTPAERVRFTWALDWLPGLLDRRRGYPPGLEPPGTSHASDGVTAGSRWAAGALAHALNRNAPGPDGNGRPLTPSDYGFVHVIVMLRRPASGLDDGEARSAVFAATQALRLESGRRQAASVLWVPERIGDRDSWMMSFAEGPLRRVAEILVSPSDAARGEQAPSDQLDAADPNQIAGGLVGLWLTHLQEAILGG